MNFSTLNSTKFGKNLSTVYLRLSKEGCFYVLGNYAADPKQHYLLKPDICVMVIA